MKLTDNQQNVNDFVADVSNSYGKKDHECLKNKELIEEYPLYGDPYDRLLTNGYGMGTGYKYKCNVCGMDWHE